MDGGNNKKYYKDYYSTLCVSRTASLGEIDTAYRDCMASVLENELDDMAKGAIASEIDEAYRCLSDSVSRRAYDDSCAAYYEVFTEERPGSVTSRSVSKEHLTIMFADMEQSMKKERASANTFRKIAVILIILTILFIGGAYCIRLQSIGNGKPGKPKVTTNSAVQYQTAAALDPYLLKSLTFRLLGQEAQADVVCCPS